MRSDDVKDGYAPKLVRFQGGKLNAIATIRQPATGYVLPSTRFSVQLKKIAVTTAKIGVSVCLLGYLGYRASQDPNFASLVTGPKNWLYLGAAWVAVLGAVMLTVLRWRMLVRTLGMPLKVADAVRIGFVGYLFTLAASLVGGDALKAAFLIHLQPKRKTEAIATVVIDRVMGLYALLLLAAVASLFLDISNLNIDDQGRAVVTRLCQVTQTVTVVSTLGMALFFIPGFTTWPLWDALEQLPIVGGSLSKLVMAMRIYRRRADVLLIALLMSLAIHSLYSFMVYFVALGLQSPHPTLGSHFVVVPVSMVAGSLPVGGFEVVLSLLYRSVSSAAVPETQGFVIALTYRILQITVASVGVIYYVSSRREVAELLHEAEEQSHEPLPADKAVAVLKN